MSRPRLPRKGSFARYKVDRKNHGHVAQYVYALEREDTKKVGRRERAVKAAAEHFDIAERTVERILAMFAPIEAVAPQVNAGWAQFRKRWVSVMESFTPDEREQILSGCDFDFPTLIRIAGDRKKIATQRLEIARLRARIRQLQR